MMVVVVAGDRISQPLISDKPSSDTITVHRTCRSECARVVGWSSQSTNIGRWFHTKMNDSFLGGEPTDDIGMFHSLFGATVVIASGVGVQKTFARSLIVLLR